MINILLYVSTGIILVSFILYFLMMLLGNKSVSNSNGFNITKDMISEYNAINVIESKHYFSIYNIKRKVIKLSTKCYYGNSLSDISLSLLEAGISILDDNKNKYINLFRKVCSNLKILYIFPIIAIFINNATYNVSDAKVSMIFIILFGVISYMLYDIKSFACLWICENIRKEKEISKNNQNKIIDFINRTLLLDKYIFLAYLIMIVRFVLILLEIN